MSRVLIVPNAKCFSWAKYLLVNCNGIPNFDLKIFLILSKLVRILIIPLHKIFGF